MQFAPVGYIAIPEAVRAVLEAFHPGEERQAAAELREHQTGELPARYYRVAEYVGAAEKWLLRALADGELVALVRVDGDDWTVPAEYWDTDSAEVATLLRGILRTVNSASQDWRQHDGQPCFIKKAHFMAWLDSTRSQIAEATDATRPSALDKDAEHWLAHDRLEISVIINLARRAEPMDWPPPTGGPWHARFRALKAVIDGSELPATLRGPVASRSTVVRLVDLEAFAHSHPAPEWDWLREFCPRWAAGYGEDRVGVTETPLHGGAPVSISHTGAQGRPTIMHIIENELERRAIAGELKPTLAAEASFLQIWASEKHPEAPIPTPKTIQNRLRDRYRERTSQHRPK